MLTYKTSLHDALYRHVEENVNPGLVITEPGESNLYFLSETVVFPRFFLVWSEASGKSVILNISHMLYMPSSKL